MGLRFENYEIVNQEGTHLQLREMLTGKVREAELTVVRDTATNKLSVGVVRHFTDPESLPWFPGSDPWTEDERRGDTE